jgi:DNA mismatch repair protein MutS
MIRQYLQIKSEVPDAILFFRMGDFYEMFFEDAVEASRVLDIALTSRDKGKKQSIPLCGVPHHAVDQYLARLVEKGYRVAICDQVEDPKTAQSIVKREIVRIVTPGLPIGLDAILGEENTFLAVLRPFEGSLGLVFLDILTGDLKILSETREETLLNHLQVHKPREILIPTGLEETFPALIKKIEKIALVTRLDPPENTDNEELDKLTREITGGDGREKTAALSIVEQGVLRLLFSYLVYTRTAHLDHVKRLQVTTRKPYLRMDEFTRRNLEIFEPLSGKTYRATLIAVLDKTRTPMGKRLLREWLRYPLQDEDEIRERLETVSEWKKDFRHRITVQALLENMGDLERLMGRVTADRANARDLVQLRETLHRLPELKEALVPCESALMRGLAGSFDVIADVAERLSQVLVDTPPVTIREGGMLREGVSEELDELRDIQISGKSWMVRFEASEQKRTGINSLKVRYNRVFGYYIEVTRANLDLVPADYQRKQTLVNAERFITQPLKEMEQKVLSAQERIQQLEYDFFIQIRDEVKKHTRRIQGAAQACALVDVLSTFGEIAERNRYCHPKIEGDSRLRVVDGRHPVVEQMNLSESFVPNDTFLDSEKDQIMLITGPNMAGKSTYIRQVALIALMAHIGSFVPASEAEIGIVDQIFTRVGASDNLALGLSTFMVEMQEAASILTRSTAKSLIVLDEIGRGTSTFDGLSIAWAIAEYLHDRYGNRGTKTLFATHYHEMTDLERLKSRIHNYNVSVREWNDEIIFLRKLSKGGMNRSYGIQVARLAGLPEDVIDRAREILSNLEKGELTETGLPYLGLSTRHPKKVRSSVQLELFPERARVAGEKIRNAPIEQMTPLEALNFLNTLKQQLKDEDAGQ